MSLFTTTRTLRWLMLNGAFIVGAGILMAASSAWAQAWPSRSVRYVLPYAPGGGTDILMRIIAPRLGEALGQQILIDNRPGGSSRIGTEIVAKAVPDGYTVLLTDTALAVNPSL